MAPGWKQYHVLEARERLEKLPEMERPKAVALVSQPGIPPKDAIEIIGSLAQRSAPSVRASSPRPRARTAATSQMR